MWWRRLGSRWRRARNTFFPWDGCSTSVSLPLLTTNVPRLPVGIWKSLEREYREALWRREEEENEA